MFRFFPGPVKTGQGGRPYRIIFPLAVYVLLLVVTTGSAQEPAQYQVRHIGLKEGLPERVINTIYQSTEGRLWIGTNNGLFIYDGVEMAFSGTRVGSKITIHGNYILNIEADAQQRIWIVTEAGLEFIDPVSNRLIPREEMDLPDSIFQEKILGIDHGRRGEIILQAGSSIYRYSDGQLRLWYSIPRHLTLRGGIVYNAKEDGVYIYLNTNDLFFLNKDGLEKLDHPIKTSDGESKGLLSFSQYKVLKLPGASDDTWLCATPGIVLYKKLQGSNTYYEFSNANRFENFVPSWKAVLDYVYSPESPIKVSNNNFFLNDIERSGPDLWIIGTEYGLFLVQEQLKYFKHLSGTEGKPIRGMIQFRPGHLLIASAQAAIDYDLSKKTGRSFSELSNIWNFIPLGNDRFLSSVETFWGLQLLSFPGAGKVRRTFPPYSTKLGFTRSMAKTPQGIWTGNLARHLFFLPTNGKPPQASPFNDDQNQGELVNAILYSPRSGLWVGSLGRLYLFQLDAQSDRIVANRSADLPPALQKIYVNALYESADGKIWIGCNQSGGLYAYDPAGRSLQHWDTSDGLPDNTVYSILGSNSDSLLWLGTQAGLSRMHVSTQSFRNFYAEDGLQQNEFNTAASYTSPDGTYYFGGMNGVSYFRPEWIPEKELPITAYLKIDVFDLKTHHQRELYPYTGDAVVFEPDEQYIQLGIRSNDLFGAEEIKGRYKIEGFSDEWRAASASDKITLAGLPAGQYKLTVQVQAPNDTWSVPFEIVMEVLPYWYNTWWFRTLLVLAISVTLYGAYRIRIRQIKKEYDMRKQLSDDLHDELGGRIFAMKALASQIAKPKLPENERRDIAEQFENLSKNVMGRVRDFIWTFDPTNDQLSEFLDRLQDFTFTAVRPVVRDLHFERDVPNNLTFATPARHHILMVFQELLTNMVKHTRSQKINIRVRIKAQHLHIEVVNQHLGLLKSSDESTGYGISSIEKRSLKHDIRLHWEEGPNTQEVEIIYKMTSHA